MVTRFYEDYVQDGGTGVKVPPCMVNLCASVASAQAFAKALQSILAN